MSNEIFHERAEHVVETLQTAIKKFATFKDKDDEKQVMKLFEVLANDHKIGDYEPSGTMEVAYERFLNYVADNEENWPTGEEDDDLIDEPTRDEDFKEIETDDEDDDDFADDEDEDDEDEEVDEEDEEGIFDEEDEEEVEEDDDDLDFGDEDEDENDEEETSPNTRTPDAGSTE